MSGCECDIRRVSVEVSDPGAFLKAIRMIGDRWCTRLIFFNAELMAGEAHVMSALLHAFRAEAAGSMISSRVEMEALLYAAGSRQCQTGMRFGLHEGLNRAYLCICPPSSGALGELLPQVVVAETGDAWETISPEKAGKLAEIFAITPAELEAAGPGRLTELVLERVALLEVYR
ncbi:KEOPS complex subunit Cgi121 [Methanolinea mesophila]|uniref:KEOPS complex subunit Cgi121 n=1 Tax=Methanolinea mesophila TaxID=547055 RepID=UPI001AE3C3A9|nr:KEOPS complex subunit Cgi121 [Methanolinea mesophila]MBP1928802.1 KEOPS complex subunit Cgi121 [Methanolinea mesophila]